MRAKSIVLISLAGFGFALWLARGGETPHGPAGPSTPAEAATAVSGTGVGGNGTRSFFGFASASASSSAPAAAVRKLDPRGERFRKRVDDQIPIRLYSEASHCYKGGGGVDERLDLSYHIRVRAGAVSITGITTSETTLKDSSIERCVRDRLLAMSWRDEELPDFEEDDDLFMRIGGWRAYLANAEDDDNIGG